MNMLHRILGYILSAALFFAASAVAPAQNAGAVPSPRMLENAVLIGVDLFKGLKVEKVVIPLPEEEQICPVCGTQMVLIGEEYVRRELEFIPATCKVIEYYSQSYGCPSCKEGLGDTEKPVIVKSQVPPALVGKVSLH